jgi:uncharacterized membrane protein
MEEDQLIKTEANDEPQLVLATPAPSSPSPAQEENDEIMHLQEVAAYPIQVVIIDEPEEDIYMPEDSQPEEQLHLHEESAPLLPAHQAAAYPIQVVTIDEPEEDIYMPEDSQPEDQLHLHDESAPLLPAHQASVHSTTEEEDPNLLEKEEDEQGAVFRDVFWAILFWLQIAIIFYLGFYVSPKGYEMMEDVDFNITLIHDFIQDNADDDLKPEDLENFIEFVKELQDWWAVYPSRVLQTFVIPMCYLSFFFVVVTTHFVIRPCTLFLVKSSLKATLATVVLVVLACIIASPSVGCILFGLLVIGGAAFFIAKVFWPKIPFAATNLQIALNGICGNFGTYVFALIFAELRVAWVLFWCYTTVGLLHYQNTQCDDSNNNDPPGRHLVEQVETKGQAITMGDLNSTSTCGATFWTFLALLLSFYWTYTVIGVSCL